jgi:hypothetical protein
MPVARFPSYVSYLGYLQIIAPVTPSWCLAVWSLTASAVATSRSSSEWVCLTEPLRRSFRIAASLLEADPFQ